MLVTEPYANESLRGVGKVVVRVARSATAVGAIAASARSDDPACDADELVRARATRAQVAARDILGHHDVELRVSGALPRGPTMIVANHLGYLDPLVLAALTRSVAIAKLEVAAWPLFGARLRELGVVFVERGDPRSGARALLGARRALDAGVSVVNFPEGTTSDGRGVLPFRRGVFGLARRVGVPIVPLRLDYDDARVCWVDDQALLPHYLWLARRTRVVAYVRIGATIVPRDGEPAASIAERARRAIAQS